MYQMYVLESTLDFLFPIISTKNGGFALTFDLQLTKKQI